MTRSTAASYWAGTATGYFESMAPAYEPGEVFPALDSAGPDPARSTPVGRWAFPVRPSREITDAIATCSTKTVVHRRVEVAATALRR